MSQEKPTQSLEISGNQLSNVQIGGQAGKNLTTIQNLQLSQGDFKQPLTTKEVVELFKKIEELLQSCDLPEAQKQRAIIHLEAAKEEAQKKEPDKSFAAKRLQKVTKILKDANETVGAGKGLWKNIQPVLQSILGYFLS